jgi:glutamate racemase
VEFVEYRCAAAGEEEKTRTVLPYLERFRAAGADALVLGCTHFLHLLEEFRREAAPAITVYDSVEGISRRIESLLGERSAGEGEGRFFVTGGAADPSWRRWAGGLGFSFSALEEPAGEGRGLPEAAGADKADRAGGNPR